MEKSNPSLIDALSENGAVVDHLRAALPEVLAVYVFGSQVHGATHKESDLDLAVLVAGRVDPVRLWDLSNELGELLNIDVDLVDLRAASTVMQYQIIMNGRRLWRKNLEVELFECFVLSEKTALDEARAGLLADIARTGKVYG